MFAALNPMLGFLQQADFVRPDIDWHALAPELTLLAVGALVTLIDVVFLEKGRKISPTIASLGLLTVLIPIVTLAVDGVASNPRQAFAGSDIYVVDGYSLILKALFILIGYMIVLMSTNYIAEGDYWESEYYGMLISSLLGMVVMASARDLVTVFVALELLSIPAYLMATWRKRDIRSNEAGLKYYLNGVFASALMLYGMSLLFGVTGSTVLSEINASLEDISNEQGQVAIVSLGIVLVIVGFAFKVSAVPFHLWAPDTYEGAPTPVTAFLAVAAKAAGFVALMNLIFVGFHSQNAVYAPALWILAALSMTIGNLTALRQDNLIRLMAYSGVAQAGFMLAALSVAGEGDAAQRSASAVVTYLIIYAAMNLGAFAIILTVARRTASAQISSFNGLFQWSPALAVVMTIFLASLAGIPPLGGWFAKFGVFTALIEADVWWAYVLATLAAVNTVVAFGYYGKLASRMWFEDAPTEFATTPIKVPFALQAAVGITALATIAFGVYPGMITHFSDVDVPGMAAAVGG
ncbi:NADH-quinone oxidoreductase subunit N [Acidimicrobiaceae bacterium]|jgi:NADH-quinone oxidoreductase subunit N|nr:NADH-quinone oxidoreductase subunit N [Acidimicrobiaceae bacterium]MDB4109670.1 NADH-quinone oxidoreductase subunit N [bacterium]